MSMNKLRLYQQTEPPQRDFGLSRFEFKFGAGIRNSRDDADSRVKK